MHPERKKEGRPRRRGGFGYIVSKDTTRHPLFAIRWQEGSTHKRKSGFKTRTEAEEALGRIRVGVGDGTLVEKRRAAIGFDAVAQEWSRLGHHSVAFIARVYGHLSQDHRVKESDRLSGLFEAPPVAAKVIQLHCR